MKRRIYKPFLVLSVLVLLGESACASEPRVILHTQGGDVPVGVEIADTPERRNLGLMYRKELATDRGMLFVFDASAPVKFWMKNTVLPLDMIFIGDDRHVIAIVKDAVPFTTTSRGPDEPSRYVLEVNAGFSARHTIAPGDEVRFENVPGVPDRAAAATKGRAVPVAPVATSVPAAP